MPPLPPPTEHAADRSPGDASWDGAADAETAEKRFEAEVERNLKRNFVAHVIHGMLGRTGFTILQAPTFLPAYVFALSGSNAVVGIARACQALGMFLTPILGATLIEHRRRVKPAVFATGAGMRLQILGLALAGYFLGAKANLWAICVFLSLFGLLTGMQSVTFQFLISKIIPVSRRGSLVGARNALAGVSAIVVSGAGGYFVEHNSLGNGYATTFLTAFVLTTCGLMCLLWVREADSPEVRPATRLSTRFRELPALVRGAPDYRWYLVARALGISGRMAQPYLVLHAAAQLDTSKGVLLALLTQVFWVSQTAANLLWGLCADRRGFRDVLLLSLVAWIAASLLAVEAQSLPAFALAFASLGAGLGGFQLAATSLVLEFGQREDLPMRIAVAQSAEQLMSIAAPLVGGVIAQSASYVSVFLTAAGLQTLAVAVTAIKVPEPRRTAPPA